MIFLFIIKILCASNLNEMTKKQRDKNENKTTLISDNNLIPSFNNFNHNFEKTPIENYNFNIAIIPNTNDLCYQNFILSNISSNLKNNEDKIYASEINFQTKIHAIKPTTTTTQHNENHISFDTDHQSCPYNFVS
ncbi:hypothetical protein DMUE_4273 [Dictyocoela muelleri]|nr:hypothetical protein DMUE_4273 [Dictyocoela muelleri]